MKKLFFLATLAFILFALRYWFEKGILIGGDLHYWYQWIQFSPLPSAWNMQRGEGLGGNNVLFLWNFFPLFFPMYFLNRLLPWSITERIVLFFPYVILSFLSSYSLLKKILQENVFAPIAGVIYSLNTYSLMILGGGQMSIAIAYSCIPFILLFLINLLEVISIKKAVAFGLLLSLELMLDLRVFYMMIPLLGIFIFYYLIFSWKRIKKMKLVTYLVIIPSFILVITQLFWLLPFVLFRTTLSQDLGTSYNSASNVVQYFSFGGFSYSLSLLHPNWPENIFGKVPFFNPLFLLLPILAFSSLFFVSLNQRKEKIFVLIFIIIGLLGIVLSNGAKDPMGVVYIWMFYHVPGFSMFRDPTKWYSYIGLSYAMLIPFTMQGLVTILSRKIHIFSHTILILALSFFACYLYLLTPLLKGQLTGTFKPTMLPTEYKQLESFLEKDNSFARTLWIPGVDRFGYYSVVHPAISGISFFEVTNTKDLLNKIKEPQEKVRLQEMGVKYIIVPQDTEGVLFVKDRKYNDQARRQVVSDIETLPYIQKMSNFTTIGVYKLSLPVSHFFLSSSGKQIAGQFISPSQYIVTIMNAKKGDRLIFSEKYDHNWYASFSNYSNRVVSQNYHNLNSFVLPQDGNYTITLSYAPQLWLNIGLWISGVAALSLVGYLLIDLIYTKRHA